MRAVLAAICLALVPAVVSGCGDDGEQTAPPPEEPVAKTTEEEAASRAGGEGSRDAMDAGEAGEMGDDAGPDQEPTEAEDERGVETAVEAVLASGDPGLACDRHVTESYVREAYGGPGGCKAGQSPQARAKAVTVTSIELAGDSAHVTAKARGGTYTGAPIEIDLVWDGDVWRVDSLTADIPAGP